jgi:hypothetical protein
MGLIREQKCKWGGGRAGYLVWGRHKNTVAVVPVGATGSELEGNGTRLLL